MLFAQQQFLAMQDRRVQRGVIIAFFDALLVQVDTVTFVQYRKRGIEKVQIIEQGQSLAVEIAFDDVVIDIRSNLSQAFRLCYFRLCSRRLLGR